MAISFIFTSSPWKQPKHIPFAWDKTAAIMDSINGELLSKEERQGKYILLINSDMRLDDTTKSYKITYGNKILWLSKKNVLGKTESGLAIPQWLAKKILDYGGFPIEKL